MFTKQELEKALSYIGTGASYPKVVEELKKAGVAKYEHFVADGRNVYYSEDGDSIDIPSRQQPIHVNSQPSIGKLSHDLKTHQAGETDYPTFCKQAGEAGVEKWIADLVAMKVSYVDMAGEELLSEDIPAAS